MTAKDIATAGITNRLLVLMKMQSAWPDDLEIEEMSMKATLVCRGAGWGIDSRGDAAKINRMTEELDAFIKPRLDGLNEAQKAREE